MTDIEAMVAALREFRDERDWAQFHNAKDLAIALSVEANELLEIFLWKSPRDAELDRVREELADVFAFAFLIADKYGLDVRTIVEEKLAANRVKYPVEKAKGSAKKYNELDEIVLICGRYAGIDQRFIHQHIDEEISIGDYVLSGGELAALVLIESISRFLPGCLGDPTSAAQDSFENGLLEAPQFTKPQLENGLSVPAVLLSGNHQKISEWRKYCSIFITLKKRPDLLVLRQDIDWKKVTTFYAQMDHADKVLLQILDLEFPHGS